MSKEAVNNVANNNRNRLIKFFALLLVVGFISIWQVFSTYSDSSTVKKEKYLLKFNLNTLKLGEVRILHQSGLPVVLMRRTMQDLKDLLVIRSIVADPDSTKSTQPAFAKNYHRSLKPEFFIAYAALPKTGREIQYRLKSFKTSFNSKGYWFGGFSEKVSGALYDKAGRSYLPGTSNLYIPQYRLTPQNKLYVYTLKELSFY